MFVGPSHSIIAVHERRQTDGLWLRCGSNSRVQFRQTVADLMAGRQRFATLLKSPAGGSRGRTGRWRAASVAFGAVPSQITAMPAHRFRVDQTVVVPWSGSQVGIPLGPYVIVRLLPMEDGEPHYRVRSSVDGHERALLESQIMRPEERLAKVEAPPAKPAQGRR